MATLKLQQWSKHLDQQNSCNKAKLIDKTNIDIKPIGLLICCCDPGHCDWVSHDPLETKTGYCVTGIAN